MPCRQSYFPLSAYMQTRWVYKFAPYSLNAYCTVRFMNIRKITFSDCFFRYFSPPLSLIAWEQKHKTTSLLNTVNTFTIPWVHNHCQINHWRWRIVAWQKCWMIENLIHWHGWHRKIYLINNTSYMSILCKYCTHTCYKYTIHVTIRMNLNPKIILNHKG